MRPCIVPFCSINGDRPDAEGLNRLNAALQAWQEGRVDRIMVSGGHRKEADLSVVYYDYLRRQGVSEDQLIIEGQSTNTLTNLANSAIILAGLEAKGEKIEQVYIASCLTHLIRIWYLIFYSRARYKSWPWPVKYMAVRAVYNKKIGYTFWNEILKILIVIFDPESKWKRAEKFHHQRFHSKH